MPTELEQRLEWWREAGLISDDQVRRILEQERTWALTAAPSAGGVAPDGVGPVGHDGESSTRRLPAIVEGLGYIGGIFTLVGAVLLVASYWDDMSTPARLALGLGSAVLLLIGGLGVRESDPALVRLRWALWTLSTAAAAVTVGIALEDGIESIEGAGIALAVSGVVAVENGLLWAGRPRPVQQALFLGAIPVVTGSVTALLTSDDIEVSIVGVVVAITGIIILAAGVRGLTVYAPLTDAIGALATIIGVMMTVEDWGGVGYLTALVVIGGLLVSVLTPWLARTNDERLTIGVVATLGMWQVVPVSIGYFAREAGLATGLVVAAVGVTAIALGRAERVAVPILVMVVGGAALVAGLAITATQSVAFATLTGLAVALGLVALGTRPGWALMSVFGAVGLLVNVPWTIAWFFPGEGRAPLLIAVAGVLIIGVAVLLARQRGRIREELDRSGPVASAGGAGSGVLRRPVAGTRVGHGADPGDGEPGRSARPIAASGGSAGGDGAGSVSGQRTSSAGGASSDA